MNSINIQILMVISVTIQRSTTFRLPRFEDYFDLRTDDRVLTEFEQLIQTLAVQKSRLMIDLFDDRIPIDRDYDYFMDFLDLTYDPLDLNVDYIDLDDQLLPVPDIGNLGKSVKKRRKHPKKKHHKKHRKPVTHHDHYKNKKMIATEPSYNLKRKEVTTEGTQLQTTTAQVKQIFNLMIVNINGAPEQIPDLIDEKTEVSVENPLIFHEKYEIGTDEKRLLFDQVFKSTTKKIKPVKVPETTESISVTKKPPVLGTVVEIVKVSEKPTQFVIENKPEIIILLTEAPVIDDYSAEKSIDQNSLPIPIDLTPITAEIVDTSGIEFDLFARNKQISDGMDDFTTKDPPIDHEINKKFENFEVITTENSPELRGEIDRLYFTTKDLRVNEENPGIFPEEIDSKSSNLLETTVRATTDHFDITTRDLEVGEEVSEKVLVVIDSKSFVTSNAEEITTEGSIELRTLTDYPVLVEKMDFKSIDNLPITTSNFEVVKTKDSPELRATTAHLDFAAIDPTRGEELPVEIVYKSIVQVITTEGYKGLRTTNDQSVDQDIPAGPTVQMNLKSIDNISITTEDSPELRRVTAITTENSLQLRTTIDLIENLVDLRLTTEPNNIEDYTRLATDLYIDNNFKLVPENLIATTESFQITSSGRSFDRVNIDNVELSIRLLNDKKFQRSDIDIEYDEISKLDQNDLRNGVTNKPNELTIESKFNHLEAVQLIPMIIKQIQMGNVSDEEMSILEQIYSPIWPMILTEVSRSIDREMDANLKRLIDLSFNRNKN